MPDLTVHVSNHAIERWVERFPGQDMAAAFARAERLTLAKYVAWRKELRKPGPSTLTGSEYYRDPATGAVFVVNVEGARPLVTTVFPLPRPDKRR